ncbi:YggT family protein [Pseudonocardiaceae bacterium YIM PH 21723]|nr:YggT family protein [Pseudonocardiaceae bacterium YIM PH 21723]
MGLIGFVLGWAVTIFVVLLIVRMILDWVAVAGGGGGGARVRAFAYSATEPVIAPVRRALPPIRAGGVGIDIAFTVVFIAALILRSLLFSL